MVQFFQNLDFTQKILFLFYVSTVNFFDCPPLSLFGLLFCLVHYCVVALSNFLIMTKITMGKISYWSIMSSADIRTKQLGLKLNKESPSIFVAISEISATFY